MSPTKRPFQPTFVAFVANRSMKRMSCGLPQLRLRDGRMTCQVGPVIGSDAAPARQPSKSPPIERGGPGNGVDLRANSSLAGVDGASGFCSGGRGLRLSEPGGVGSIKCFSCARAEPAAARMRTASRRAAARISNYSSYGPVSHWWRVRRLGLSDLTMDECPLLALTVKQNLVRRRSGYPSGAMVGLRE